MISTVIHTLKALGVDTRRIYHMLSRWSLKEAVREQSLTETVERLRSIVPDLRDQFTGSFDEQEYLRYWELKMRAAHGWQLNCIMEALELIPRRNLTIADIGDSSGTHGTYVKALAPKGKVASVVSVNLDPLAVTRIRAKGGEAIESRAEDLADHAIRADLYLSFETLEHLTDPLRFLHGIAERGDGEWLLMTVPYRRKSRFGGVHMRMPEPQSPRSMTAEEVHIYEFSPDDWTLLVRFAGFRPLFVRTYRQYARRSFSRLVAPLWRKLDFEGFVAIFASRDLTYSQRYADW